MKNEELERIGGQKRERREDYVGKLYEKGKVGRGCKFQTLRGVFRFTIWANLDWLRSKVRNSAAPISNAAAT